MPKVRWGVLSTAKIAREKVIPAMQRGGLCEVSGIASRDYANALKVARSLDIRRAYGSYEDLLADPEIDAIYNPLPNHLHVPWSIRAIESGKHVLCEKPIGLDADDARRLLNASRGYPLVKVMEAFMYRFHPQWQHARALVQDGVIGDLRTIHSFFSYFNVNPENVRNQRDMGGGALMDIGCYCISLSRFLFGGEPRRVLGVIDEDPRFGIDRITSGILDFGDRTSTFTCATQLGPHQRAEFFGSDGRIEIEIPFNAPPRRRCRLHVYRRGRSEEVSFPRTDQYTVQADLFSRAVLEDRPVPTPLEDALSNMIVIDAVRESARRGTWVDIWNTKADNLGDTATSV